MKTILTLVAFFVGTNVSAQSSGNNEMAEIADMVYIVSCSDKSTYVQTLTDKYGNLGPDFAPEQQREMMQLLLGGTEEQVRQEIQKQLALSGGFEEIVLAMLCTVPEMKSKEINASCLNDKTGAQMSTDTLLKVCGEF
jgi:hypothetical protein